MGEKERKRKGEKPGLFASLLLLWPTPFLQPFVKEDSFPLPISRFGTIGKKIEVGRESEGRRREKRKVEDEYIQRSLVMSSSSSLCGEKQPILLTLSITLFFNVFVPKKKIGKDGGLLFLPHSSYYIFLSG